MATPPARYLACTSSPLGYRPPPLRFIDRKEQEMAGLSVGGILVIIGIVVAIVWSVWLGIIIALIGLIAFGGFARGRWY
jgi:hypothetical protein